MMHMIPADGFCEGKVYCLFRHEQECLLYHVDLTIGEGLDYLGFSRHDRAFPCKTQWPDGAKLIKERHE